jgi:uncharacterized protein (DUF302 family)
MSVAFEVDLRAPFPDAIDRVTAAVKSEGFGVLTRIDIHSTPREKLAVDFRPYTIRGACNPRLAHRALTSNAIAGLLLPCNVTVEATPNGHVVVRIADPEAMLQLGDLATDQRLRDVSQDARTRLSRVADALRRREMAA